MKGTSVALFAMRRWRWIPWIFLPAWATATDLGGVWSAPIDAGTTAVNRAVIVDAGDRLYFHYVCDGPHRCEVFGIARQRSSPSGTAYVFRNDEEHRFYPGYEGYGFEEHRDCEVSFELDGLILRVRSTGNCSSFCGMRAGIGGDLRKVPEEKLSIHAGEQPAG